MMLANLLVPIVFIILIALAIAFLVVKMMKGSGKRKGKYHFRKRVYWILGGYITVLLVCFVFDVAHPVNGMMEDRKIVKEKDLNRENSELYVAALEGKIAETGNQFIVKKWDFDYHGKKLNITSENGEFFNERVVVERKKGNDGKIEAVYYQTRSSVDHREISEKKRPIRIQLSEATLMLGEQERVELKFSQFENAFTVNQFSGSGWFNHESNFYEGQGIVYLQIPKDLDLEAQSEFDLQYVNN
ncbi:hypothetical protein [Neobacillus niacini]|uniref:hypothetical protein n=1 Tax=Neobacillus niacini TaxID=86668 RepID=UPI0028617F25|nr:hypothetical protein [Neobacillus niacini]MDR7001234.1 hypothetical protein [Neobacillus niacini]